MYIYPQNPSVNPVGNIFSRANLAPSYPLYQHTYQPLLLHMYMHMNVHMFVKAGLARKFSVDAIEFSYFCISLFNSVHFIVREHGRNV